MVLSLLDKVKNLGDTLSAHTDSVCKAVVFTLKFKSNKAIRENSGGQ